MAAVYPSGIKNWPTPVQDAVDTVYAAHVNDLRDEVMAVESEIGTGLKTSTWTGAFAQSASWGSLSLRLANIERGLVTSTDVHSQYVKKSGDTMTGNLVVPSPTSAQHAATKGYVDGAVGSWQIWTPTFTCGGETPAGASSLGRYVRTGNTVRGWAQTVLSVAALSSGTLQWTFPVTPTHTSLVVGSSLISGGGEPRFGGLMQLFGGTMRCVASYADFYGRAAVLTKDLLATLGIDSLTVTFDFTYEV